MIKGISDVRRLPRLGKIRLGEKRKSPKDGREYPAKLDHFNFRDVPQVAAVYGDHCTELDIVIPVENQDVFFSQERKAYRLAGIFCKCSDGVTAIRVRVGLADGSNPKVAKGAILDPDGEAHIKEHGIECEVGEMFEMPCPGDECPFSDRKMCRPIGRLLFMLPKVPGFGCYEISTTSFNSMVVINSYIEAIRSAAGRVSMIPLKMRLVQKKVQVDGKATSIFHLELVYTGTLASLMQYQGAKALPAPVSAAAMPTPAELDNDAPDDLMPHGGGALDNHLGGQPLPAPKDRAKEIADEAKSRIGAPPAPAPAAPAKETPAPAGVPEVPPAGNDPLDDEPPCGSSGPTPSPPDAKPAGSPRPPIWPGAEEEKAARPSGSSKKAAPRNPKRF